jgi:succinoglycan biosynthesis transport protein ExoP
MQEQESSAGNGAGGQLPQNPNQLPLVHATDRRTDRLSPHEHAEADGDGAGNTVDLRRYWLIILKRKWTVVYAFAIVFLTTLVATLLMTPIYRASTTVEIDRASDKVVQIQGINDASISDQDQQYLNTQYQLLQSLALSRRVAGQLHLANDPLYLQIQNASPLAKLFSMLIPGQKPDKVTLESDAQSIALGDFVNKNLEIDPVQQTLLVTINFDSPNPSLSAKIANSIADNFIASNLEHSFNASSYARSYLEGRLAQLKQKLTESDTHLVQIANKEKLILDSTGRAALTMSNLGSMTSAIVTAQGARTHAESRMNLVNSLPNDAMPSELLPGSLVDSLRQQKATLTSDYQQKLSTYKPGYPTMLAEKSQIDSLDAQIARDYAGVRKSARSEYEADVAQENLLNKEMDTLKNQLFDQQNRSIEYSVALQDVNTNQQLYDGLLQRYKEIGIAGGVTTNNMSVVDVADVPAKVYKPNLVMYLALATLFGLGLGVFLALFFEYLDDTIKTPQDIEKLLGLPSLGVIPRLQEDGTPLEALADQRSAFSEAYRSLRTALQFSTASGVPRSLLVTSATPGEGKSTTAMTLGLNFAQLGQRVLLIDADLRNPSLHKLFGVENTIGLSNFLSSEIDPQNAIQSVPNSSLDVMTSGPLPPNPAELLAGPKMLSMLSVAKARYDLVIIDGPPTIGIADAPLLAHIAMGTMLVVDAGGTRRDVVRDAVKRLSSARARIVGVVMTKYDAKLAGYGYYYGSYSYYTYESDTPKLTKK